MEHITHEALSNLILKTLSPQEEARLQRHLEECPRCQAVFTEEKALHEALFDIIPQDPPIGFALAVMDSIEEEVELDPGSSFWYRLMKTALITGIILALVVSIYAIVTTANEPLVFSEEISSTVLIVLTSSILAWGWFVWDRWLGQSKTSQQPIGS